MDPTLQQYLDICFRRTTNALRWIGLILTAFFAIVFLFAVYSVLAAPKMHGGMFIGLAIVGVFVAGSFAVYAHAERVRKRLHYVFYEAPEKVFKIDAKVIQSGPMTNYMFHLHSPKPVKMVGINVPNQATFDALRSLLPQHFHNANRG